ncbi:MAG TPA: hypothetical protein VKY44_01965 [Flavobacterium sp.]|nr:hypothetical protein [Flavobacterium sp.]
MKKNPIYIILSLIFLITCQYKQENSKTHTITPDSSSIKNDNITRGDSLFPGNLEQADKKSFRSSFKSDFTIEKSMVKHSIDISNKDETVKLPAFCNCEKNKKNNTIKIQLTAAIPTSSELEQGITGSRLFSDIGPGNDFKGQLKFLTFHLKDSTINKMQLLSKSTDKEYHGSDFKYSDIEKYEVTISKFDYSIASDIYGKFKIILPEPFGYIENDTILEGTFKCNNWRINKFNDIKESDLNKRNESKNRELRFSNS